MSGSDALLLVGATTLIAAILTLFAFQMTAAKSERRMNRRSRTLEEPVPGRRALSTIGLNTESTQRSPRPYRPPVRQPATHLGPPTDDTEELDPTNLTAQSVPSPAKESGLNSLQTIRARSAALHADAQPDQSAAPKPLTPVGSPPVQRLPKRPVSETDQEQGPATPHGKTRPDKAGGAVSASQSSEPAVEPTIPPKTTTSKRAKRVNAQPERIGTAHRGPDRVSANAIPDSPSLDLLDALQASEIGASFGRDSVLPDIFAGLNEAEAGMQGLPDDLTDIDGGGLPTPAPKTPQKSRR